MPAASPLASSLAAGLAGRPSAQDAVARAVADEDAPALAALLRTFGLDPAAESVERFLDAPGPFGPALAGCT